MSLAWHGHHAITVIFENDALFFSCLITFSTQTALSLSHVAFPFSFLSAVRTECLHSYCT